jgi:hypothetical protein
LPLELWEAGRKSAGFLRIYDSIRTNGNVSRVSFSYNQGTFIGACNFLGRTNDAAEVMDYAMHKQGVPAKEFQIYRPIGFRQIPLDFTEFFCGGRRGTCETDV